MIPPELEARILRLYDVEKWPIGTIAKQLGLHHTTVRRALARSGVAEAARSTRPSIVDPYLPFIRQTLKRYPTLRSSRLYEMVRQRGYPGRPDHFRHLVALHRPRRPAEAFLRLKTLPGEQAQADWGHFGKVAVPGGERRLSAFVLVLSYSRQIFLRFFYDQKMESFLSGHQAAFVDWGGSVRVVLYDNLKSVVLERIGDAIRFHPQLLSFASFYRYEPRPVAVARGNEKGRVERSLRYVREAFFAARSWRDLDDLNAQAHAWCHGLAAERRCPEDRTLTVREAFEQEREALLPLPETTYPTEERQPVQVGKTPYVRFDGNDYSVPHTHVRRTLVVLASLEQVRILDGSEVVATHARSWGRHQQIEDPRHLEELVRTKRQASRHRGLDRLAHAVPPSRELLAHLAHRGAKLGGATTALLGLLDRYGARALTAAIEEALEQGSPHPHTVRLVLERRQRGAPPPVPVRLPPDPRVRDLVVKPHELSGYDALIGEDDDDDPRS